MTASYRHGNVAPDAVLDIVRLAMEVGASVSISPALQTFGGSVLTYAVDVDELPAERVAPIDRVATRPAKDEVTA